MEFTSILFEPTAAVYKETTVVPEFFIDLNLDQLVDAICAPREEYRLQSFFCLSLKNEKSIIYRQAVMKDLEKDIIRLAIESFTEQMRTMRRYLDQGGKLYYRYQKQRWFLDAVELYCRAVSELAHNLEAAQLMSAGLTAFRDYLIGYTLSESFRFLQTESAGLEEALAAIRYCLRVDSKTYRGKKNGVCIEICPYAGERDYSAEVETIFAKFQQGAAQDFRVSFTDPADMDSVEAGVLEQVALMHPDIFSHLEEFCSRNRGYLDSKLGEFDREIQFYLAYLEYISPIKQSGLHFCYPRMSERKNIHNYGGFDIVLAAKLTKAGTKVIENDYYLRDQERIIVVTGPNQGGKTTFARAYGQMHYLASLGLPIPGTEAQLLLFDRIFTHFEKEENIQTLAGKLQDDLCRIQNILTASTQNSIIIMNEIFTSTTLQDAIFLSEQIMAKLERQEVMGVWVTFIDELASFSPATVSMVSSIAADNPAQRTYRILRRPADGLSYALSIAEKYNLTYAGLKERIHS